MFRRAASSIGKLTAGVAAAQLGAAGVALTDKELGKKPEWYQMGVRSLEDSLKKLSKYGYIESPGTLNEAHETLGKVSDIVNTEIQWRIARILIEKAELSKCPKEKKHLLHEAKEHAKQALAVEPAKGSSGAHKWYAIALAKLDSLEKGDHLKCIAKHLEKAVDLDPKDPYAAHLLGVAEYKRKNYKEAIASFEKAEEIKNNFSAANLYYLGVAQKAAGKKEDAIKNLKQSIQTLPRNGSDSKARSQAKATLAKLGLKPHEYEVEDL